MSNITPYAYGTAPTVPGRIGSGAPGALGMAIEATKGTPAPIVDWVPISGNTIAVAWDKLAKDVYVGERHTEQVVRLLKGKVAGNITHSVFGNAGAPLFAMALGKEIHHPAGTKVTNVPKALSNGLMAITDTGAGVPIGGLVAVTPTGSTRMLECLQVVDIAAGKVYVKQPKARNLTAFGGNVDYQLIDQHEFVIRAMTDTLVFEAPTATMEINKGRQHAWRLAGCRNLKFDIKGAKQDAEVTHTIVGTEEPVELLEGAYTIPMLGQTAAEAAELTRPFTIRDGYALVPNDQASQGSMFLNQLVGLEEWGCSWDQGGIDKDFWNDSRIKDNYLGKTKGTVTYKFSNQAGRLAEYQAYLAAEGAPPVPFFLTMAIPDIDAVLGNNGFTAMGIYVPSMLITKADSAEPIGDTMTVNVEADIVKPTNGDASPIHVFVANATLAPYIVAGGIAAA